MNPGTFYSAASLLNPRAKQKGKKQANGQPKNQVIPSIAPMPSAHALLNPKGFVAGNADRKDKMEEVSVSLSNRQPHPFLNSSLAAGTRDVPVNPQPQFVFASAFDEPNEDDQMEQDYDHVGQASLLARSQNLRDRPEHHAKRQKLSEDDNNTWITSTGNSGVSRHFKEKREEAAANGRVTNLPAATAEPEEADDTADMNDDESFETAEENSEDEQAADTQDTEPVKDPEVCIGQLDGARINMDRVPAMPETSTSLGNTRWPPSRISLRKLGVRDMRITAFDCDNNDFATLDSKWAYSISQAMTARKITKLSCRLLSRPRKPGQRVGQQTSEGALVQVLVYCKKSMAVNLYNQLLKQKTPLCEPIGPEEWRQKINYYDVVGDQDEDSILNTGGRIDAKALKQLEHDIFDVLDQIPEHNELARKQEDPEYIATPLLDYQRQGLQFMTEQEIDAPGFLEEDDPSADGPAARSLWRFRREEKTVIKYFNRATGHTQEEKPQQVMGGLLADQMGLGKTLTVIALVASTIDDAEDWCHRPEERVVVYNRELVNVRTTLIIAPTTVLQNWEEQLKKHVVGENLSFLKYHGPGRPTNLQDLTDYDIIFTTYGTVQREMSWRNDRDRRVKSLFARFKFHRIVLDEAHYIKGHTTDRAKSIFDLHAKHKWAVTGTPIQNGLEDFGSILKFLGLTPFDKQFKELVMAPAKRDPKRVVGMMRLIFNSITLRRTKEKLTLPKNTKIVETVVLREEERSIYTRFTAAIQHNIKSIAREDLSKNYMTFFQQLSSCRRICDSIDLLSNKEKSRIDFDWQPSRSDEESAQSQEQPQGIDLTDAEGYKQLDALDQCMAANCSRCGSPLLKDQIDEEFDDGEIGRFWDCQCFICPDCAEDFEDDVKKQQNGEFFTCPETDVIARARSIKLTYKKLVQFRKELLRKEQQGSRTIAERYTRASSKTEALLRHLEERRQLDEDGELPHKSVVFTYWSNYLDLLQIDLTNAGYSYLRLDGSVSQKKRVQILEQFNSDSSVTVLLATIGVGGVGLNLQIADAVFIMEPQWNPASEEQAIDRVHRLGQKRDVKTVRFIVHDSVETNVRKMAQGKQALADLTTSNVKIQRGEVTGKVQDLLDILNRR